MPYNIVNNTHVVLFLHFIGFLLFVGYTNAYSQNNIFNPIEEAIRLGDTKKLISYLGPFVDISIDGEKKINSKEQADLTFQNFFHLHSPSYFSIIHTGYSKKELKYAIGQYKSRDSNYSVLIKMKKINTKYLIYEISFIVE